MLGGIIDILMRADSKQLDNTLDKSANKLKQWKKQAAPDNAFKSAIDGVTGKMSGMIGGIAAAGIAFVSLHHIISEVKNQLNEISAMDKLADRLGMSVPEVETYTLALKKAGVGAEELAPMFYKLENHISQAASGSAEAKGAFDELGLSVSELKGKSPDAQFRAIGDAISQIPNQADRIRLLMEMFGKSGGELETMFRKGSKGLDDMKAKLDKFGLSTTPLEAAQVKQATDAMNEYSLVWEGIWKKTTTSFAPDIAAAFSTVTDAILDTKDGSSLLTQVLDLGHDAWNFIIEAAYRAYNVFKFVRGEVSSLIAGLASLLSHIPGLGGALKDFAADLQRSADKDLKESLDSTTVSAVSIIEQRKKKLEAEARAKLAARQAEANKSQSAASGEQFSRPLNELIYKYKEEAATLFMTTHEKEVYNAVQKQGNTAMEATARSYASYLDALDTEKKILEADVVSKAIKHRQELDNALKQGTISQYAYNMEIEKDKQSITGVTTAWDKARLQIETLDRGFKAGTISEKEWYEGFDAAKDSLLGFSDPMKEYTKRIDVLDEALKHNVISWKEYSKGVQEALAKSFGVPKSIDQQFKEWKEKYNRIFTIKGLTDDQKRTMEKDAMPAFVKQLYESTKTPMEKFQDKMRELNAWKSKMDPSLYARGVLGAVNEMGIGEHRFSQAATQGSTEARSIIMGNKTKRDDVQIQQAILKMNEQQLKAMVDNAANTKRIADATGSQLVLQLPAG